MRHVPAVHVGVALASAQRLPQPPQWAVFVAKSASQPFAVLPSQLPKPLLHVIDAHTPPEQVGVPFVASQRLPHAPQLLRSVVSVTSQPLVDDPSQSARGEVQAAPTPQVPTPDTLGAQKAVRPVGAVQRVPQAPQLVTSVVVAVSHPSAVSLLQLAKPAVQAPMVHTPPTQVAPALAKRQRLPQAPQLLVSVAVLVSQPAAVVQSPKPERQATCVHVPDTHCCTELVGTPLQTVPQPPQLLLSLCAFTQNELDPLPQRVWPVGHTHAPMEQN